MKSVKKALIKGGALSTLALSTITPILASSYRYSYESSGDDAAIGGFMIVIYCCICIFSLLYLGLKVYLTIDATKRDYGEDSSMKIVGILLIWILDWILPIIGLLLYYFLVMRKFPKKS